MQESAVQQKRPAPSTSSSNCQDKIPITKTPNVSKLTETVNKCTIKGALATKLKDSTKNPHSPQKNQNAQTRSNKICLNYLFNNNKTG